MIIVIIAGGSGTRLWPLSTPDFPKHLLKINGDKLSLLQHTYSRAKMLSNKIYVVSEKSHIAEVRKQLKELPKDAFICEPGRKGTANCIIAALDYINSKGPTKEVIAFTHADHYIRDKSGFAYSFKVAEQVALAEKRIVLVGIEPDYPATCFGYIKKGSLLEDKALAFNVDSFKEKPDFETAKKYLASGNYVWNAGYFLATMDTFLTTLEKYAPELYSSYQKLSNSKTKDKEKVYLTFENDAIEYALIEQVPNLLVIPASFDWMDLGSYSDLHKAIGSDKQGNHIHGKVESVEVENSFIQNHEDKPVAVIGLDNVVVINTKDGTLVARKDLAQMVGVVSKKINE